MCHEIEAALEKAQQVIRLYFADAFRTSRTSHMRRRYNRILMLGWSLVATAAVGAQTAQPFSVGDHAEYDVRFGIVHAGTATLSVVSVDSIRGRPAFHIRLTIAGGVNLVLYKYVLRDTLESWIDTTTRNSLRFTQRQWHQGKLRSKNYELFPERETFADGSEVEQASVPSPLDDLGVLYLARTLPLEVGATLEIARHFKPASNPVILKVLKRDTIEAGGRRWPTIVVQPLIKTSTMFADGEGRVWLSDDAERRIVQLSAKVSIGTITMKLRSSGSKF